MKVRTKAIFISSILVFAALLPAFAQDTGPAPAQAASIPGLGAIPFGLNGPGYVEFGGGYSDMYPRPYVPWRDAYMRIVASGDGNTFNGEVSRQDHYGDTGWYYGAGLARDFGENWFTDVHAGSSVGGFFLPKLRLDGTINRKILKRKQLVLTATGGYDKSKQVNHDYRVGGGFTYYTNWSIVAQAGMTATHADPGSLVDIAEYLALTQGHEKEHLVTFRVGLGKEGYEIVGPQTALMDFHLRQYSGIWRQWVGVNWGFNVIFNHENSPFYRRNGGTVGLFFEF
jgi:YaiO family outer membrane protein